MKKATTRKSGSKLWENISKLCEVLDGALHKIFWEGNLFSKILYILFPFFLILGFGLVLFRNDAFLMENSGYGFLDDYANCYMLMYIFFFMYFAHGLYLPWLDKTVDEFGKKYASKKYIDYKNKKAIRTIKSVILVVSLVLSILAFQFIGTALDYGNLNWYSKLNVLELAYYSALIVLAWVMSAKLFITIAAQFVVLYCYIKEMSGCLNIYCYDKKCGLKNVYDAIMTAMGFGVYFLIAVAMIIYSDFRAHTDFHLDMAGYKNAWVIVSFAIILTVVYYAIIIITYCSLKYKIKEEMDKHTSEQISDNKNDILSNLSLSVLNFHDICIFLLTVLFPGLAALIQIMPSII